ncbi:MAG: hypothetical protein P4L85_20775 [Paludisphaera borealis]|uniref:hypothetical protein n=1 Tax=Paludisphaera borealis TaxID=1387353 RepID=UPI00284630D3|nr:hypothetical protein [Paludisphaera borealis]MDR3621800.1 hypothetical protein [Paludisphaera borealis]
METPQIRPGAVSSPEPKLRVLAYFYNAAEGNLAVQLLTGIGIPSDRLGVTPPDQLEGGQGMLLSVGCPTEALQAKAESILRKLGGEIHRQRG